MNNYFTTHGRMSDPGKFKEMLGHIPKDIDKIVELTQNFMMHAHCAPFYGVEPGEEGWKETWLRSLEEKLALLKKKGYASIHDNIPYKEKVVGICRDFAMVSSALCREVGIPTRARCGFATYFEKDIFMDHWVFEYWNEEENRWIMVDSQFDQLLIDKFKIDFNPKDMKRSDMDRKENGEKAFLVGGEAWKLCRAGKADPQKFGILDFWGWDYLVCNLILDANSLLKNPMQPWDLWPGLKMKPFAEWSEEEIALMDRLAELSENVDDKDGENFCGLKELVESNEEIRVPEDLGTVINNLETGK